MKERLEGGVWDGLTLDREAALEHLLGVLKDTFGSGYEKEVILEHGTVRIPEWELTVRPEVPEVRENSIMLYFHLTSPAWDREVFECSVGMGETPMKAMSMAAGSFMFATMDGICAMLQDWEPQELSSEFAGSGHDWKVYKSNIVGMGETPAQEDCPDYWGELSEEIAKRLGNQKLCYIKLYGAKNGDDITGECRINDVKNDELSGKMADSVARWKTESFGSHKQFIFLKQREETTRPYPFTEEELAEHTRTAVRMFHECETDEEYESFPRRLAEAVGDDCLAQELYAFIPELCAENAFPQISYPDEINFSIGERSVSAYKNQLASYYTIQKALFDGFAEGAFSPWQDQVYRDYISVSSIYSVICSAKEQGADLTADGGRIALSYGVQDWYELR